MRQDLKLVAREDNRMSSAYMNTAIPQERLSLGDLRLYLATVAMVVGNVALPALVHGIPNGGRIFLPIFFFTLIAGWRFGIYAALFTAVLSPLANHVLTGMPAAPALSAIILQSALLGALAAGAARTRKATLAMLALVVLLHQVLIASPRLLDGGLQAALGAFRMRLPGMVFQILGGFLALRLMGRWLPVSPKAIHD
jgi:hypothetical protein